MGLSEYRVVINGYETTLQLTEEDARKRGLTKQQPAPVEKPAAKPRSTARSRTARNKED